MPIMPLPWLYGMLLELDYSLFWDADNVHEVLEKQVI